ncbi:MAG: hypothetical protein IJW86_09105 [Clostridia bacterium]|nr:hypothetical protein [Clostridia bacterium]
MKKAKLISIILVFCILIGGASIWLFAKDDGEISTWERRKLQQFPEIKWERVVDGKFMKEFVSYLSDQFPLRDELRRLKANVLFNFYQQKDNGGIYIQDGSASKIDSKINMSSVEHFTSRMDYLYDKYLKGTDCKVYYSIVPDKNYFLAEKGGYPHLDYDELYHLLSDELSYMSEIEIKHLLSAEDYYTTDTHWKQESIVDVANEIRQQMGLDAVTDYEEKSLGDFYGVYYGQSALPLDPDTLTYLTNNELSSCTVKNFENGSETKVYNEEKYTGLDPYDVYLSGAVSVLEITNPKGEEGKELVVFRDSFGSSLVPLLLSGYSKVTLIDIRYIMPDMISQFTEFGNQDVLILYSTMMVNSSSTLK